MRRPIKDLEDAFGFRATNPDAVQALRSKETVCMLSPVGVPNFDMMLEGTGVDADNPNELTLLQFMQIVSEYCDESRDYAVVSNDNYERNYLWIQKQDWKR